MGGDLIQQKNLIWRKHSPGHHGFAKTKKIQTPLISFGKEEEMKFVTLPPPPPPYWELVGQASQLPSAGSLPDPSTLGSGDLKRWEWSVTHCLLIHHAPISVLLWNPQRWDVYLLAILIVSVWAHKELR